PVYYHVRSESWVDYTEKKQGRLTPSHPFYWTNFRRTANRECLDCHATGLEVSYDRHKRTWDTRFIDAGVACEACHGPGRAHAESSAVADIVHPAKLDSERSMDLCGQCHGIRKPLYPLLDHENRFRPGQRYQDYYQLITAASRSAGLLRDFFADGRPQASSYEYTALIQSECYSKGEATCLSCHVPPHGDYDLHELPRAPDGAGPWSDGDHTCRSCHAEMFRPGGGHSKHKTPEAQSCVACHMPSVLSSVMDKFGDHALDVPAPQNTVRHGIPNACNVCHDDRSPAEMVSAMAEMWPNALTRQQRRLRLADAFADRKGEDSSTAADGSTEPRGLVALRQVLADADEVPSLRGAAALRLAQRYPDRAAAILVGHADDASPLVRVQVIDALILTRSPQTAAVATKRLDDPELLVRHQAAITLASLQEPAGEAVVAAMTRDPRTAMLPQPHIGLGFYLLRRGDLDGAQAALERSLDLMPFSAQALILLADIQVRRRDAVRARAYLAEALRYEPGNRIAQRRMAALQGRR
ncbi:MAG: multiheme c-type cytochrome, partial [Myxococcota bacterium]